MREVDGALFPSSSDIWYAGQLKAFAAQLPAVAPRYGLSTITVMHVQCLALEFMEILIYRVGYAAEYLRQYQQSGIASLHLVTELAISWDEYKRSLQNFFRQLVSYLRQHVAYTVADDSALALATLAS